MLASWQIGIGSAQILSLTIETYGGDIALF
jgi:hypothetical protein